jgi:hypothetical protein
MQHHAIEFFFPKPILKYIHIMLCLSFVLINLGLS